MNADQLLAHYDQVADAPDAIDHLRRFILDLAVRGKLVEQDSTDEPADELLKQITAELKHLGVKLSVSEVSAHEAPYNLPKGWRWTRIGAICSKTGSGSTPRGGKSVYKKSGVAFLRSQNVYNDGLRLDDVAFIDLKTHEKMKGTRVLPGDLLLNITGGSMGRCCHVSDDFEEANVSQHVAIIRPALKGVGTYLHSLILSPYFQSFIFDEQTGAGRGGLPKNRMDKIVLALPPMAEQERIVAKVNELMGLCDELAAARDAREAIRDRLAAVSLARLNAPDPETFTDDARFALDALPAITARTDQINQLRQTILNLAVCGKLVPRDKNEELAAELLKRIAEEKDRLIKVGEIVSGRSTARKEGPKPSFSIPQHWEQVRFMEILDGIQTGPFGSSLHQSDYVSGGTPVVNPASLQNERIIPIEKMAVGPDTLNRLSSFKLREGDIVMARRGEMGRCAPVTENEEGWLCGTGSLILRPSKLLHQPFVVLLIGSPFSREYLGGSAVGATMQNLNQSILLGMPIGLPPLAEQERIVAKVEELMVLCDRLEESLSTGEDTRRRLLEALLHEALSPVSSRSQDMVHL